MRFLHGKMRDSAVLNLATNLKWYAEEAVEYLTQDGGFILTGNRVLTAKDEPRTHFERKYLARGESCFDLNFEKGLH
jgi:tRNA G46 methylase TrmB